MGPSRKPPNPGKVMASDITLSVMTTQMWPEACGGGAVTLRAVLVYSATLLNAPWIQTALALQATQTALAADLLQCNAVGAFTAGAFKHSSCSMTSRLLTYLPRD